MIGRTREEPVIARPGQYRAVAFDLDGTLLDPGSTLRPAVVSGVRKLVDECGVTVVIATGRVEPSAEIFWKQLGLKTPIVSCNGAYIGFPGNGPIFHNPLPGTIIPPVLAAAKSLSCHLNFYLDNEVVVAEDTECIKWYAGHYLINYRVMNQEEIITGSGTTKILGILGEDNKAELARRVFSEALGGSAAVTESNGRFIEIISPGVNKGAALTWLSQKLDIPIGQWVAAGDALNDLEMLSTVGLGLTPKDGDERLRRDFTAIQPLWDGGMDWLVNSVFSAK